MKARAAAMTELAKLASDSAVSTSKRTSNAGMPMAAIEPAISCVEKRSLHDRFERTSWTDLISSWSMIVATAFGAGYCGRRGLPSIINVLQRTANAALPGDRVSQTTRITTRRHARSQDPVRAARRCLAGGGPRCGARDRDERQCGARTDYRAALRHGRPGRSRSRRSAPAGPRTRRRVRPSARTVAAAIRQRRERRSALPRHRRCG